MIVLEGDEPLGADAHQYYDELWSSEFDADTKHVQHVQDFWGDPLTAAGSQSSDGKAAYVQVFLSGNQGEALSLESVDAVREIVDKHARPARGEGLRHRRGRPDRRPVRGRQREHRTGHRADGRRHRGDAPDRLPLLRHDAARRWSRCSSRWPPPAASSSFLANANLIGLSTYSTNILTLLVIAAGTDYVIFLLGRYHEARGLGEDRETAYYDMYHGTTHVILGSGLTIAGAVACLYFTRLPYFQSLGIPAAHRRAGRVRRVARRWRPP